MASIPLFPRILGFAGLLPQLACLFAVLLGGPEWRFTALAISYGYAALIFSFLGGMWWGIAAAHDLAGAAGTAGQRAAGWIYIAAVLPSLIALISYLPWIYGMEWPAPSLMLLGLCIAASPLIDRRLSVLTPPWWMPLRWMLSLELGGLTFILGIFG